MTQPASEQLIHIRSDRTKFMRITLLFTLSMALVFCLQFVLFIGESDRFPILYRILMGGNFLLFAIAGKSVVTSVEVNLTEDYLQVNRGTGFLKRRGERIPLKDIHTIRIVDIQKGETFRPGMIYAIYRAPARKSVYTVAEISMVAIPDPLPFIFELIDRTDATIKVITIGEMGDTIVSREELATLLYGEESLS